MLAGVLVGVLGYWWWCCSTSGGAGVWGGCRVASGGAEVLAGVLEYWVLSGVSWGLLGC